MDLATKPDAALARRTLPAPLWRALNHVFAQGVGDMMLVGGTALAGFYAGHRRSDDLDLFAASPEAHRAAVLATQSLVGLGSALSSPQHTPQYYRALCQLDSHRFTVDVVLDENLFRIGRALAAEGPIMVASLETLLATKAATLVSRCSEKDLYDLLWMLTHLEGIELRDLLAIGARVDGGVNAESVLLAVTGTQLSPRACGFATAQGHTAPQVLAAVTAFQGELEKALIGLLEGEKVPPLGELVRRITSWRGE